MGLGDLTLEAIQPMMMMVVSTKLRAQVSREMRPLIMLQACARRGNLSKNENERDSRKTRRKNTS